MIDYKDNVAFIMEIAELLANDSSAVMILFAAYTNDGLCYEFFCEGIPYEDYIVLRDELTTNLELRDVLKKCGVVESGVRRYICTALDDYNMFYHFIDGISNILADKELMCMLPVRERNLVCSLISYWSEGELTENSWETLLRTLRRSV